MFAPSPKSNELDDCTTWELVERLQLILENCRRRQEVLHAKEEDAQRWLGILQRVRFAHSDPQFLTQKLSS